MTGPRSKYVSSGAAEAQVREQAERARGAPHSTDLQRVAGSQLLARHMNILHAHVHTCTYTCTMCTTIRSPSDHHHITITSPSDHHQITINQIPITSPSDHHHITISSPSHHHHHHQITI